MRSRQRVARRSCIQFAHQYDLSQSAHSSLRGVGEVERGHDRNAAGESVPCAQKGHRVQLGICVAVRRRGKEDANHSFPSRVHLQLHALRVLPIWRVVLRDHHEGRIETRVLHRVEERGKARHVHGHVRPVCEVHVRSRCLPRVLLEGFADQGRAGQGCHRDRCVLM